MKTLFVVGLTLLAITLAGCFNDGAKELSFPVLPDGLKDCQFYKISSSRDYERINVVRCPNSSTSVTYKQGKSTINTVVIDGVEYVKKQ